MGTRGQGAEQQWTQADPIYRVGPKHKGKQWELEAQEHSVDRSEQPQQKVDRDKIHL